ncbi:hypothetical protein ACTWP4_06595 [Gracilibacillus sp. D59]|uniref:hypothetical protein n=1 Tax=Gracilibacillus sp. D59 TaxID=3457434 RepID=UPI003FCDB6CA
MRNDKPIQEQTAADKKAIGFDYQYYYFLYELLQMKEGQSVGYEVKDDVHIDTIEGKQTLIQLKHSIDTQSKVTEKDSALWKTISNWIEIISDNASNRGNYDVQLEFLTNTKFLLVTNKSNSTDNEFFNKVKLLKQESISIDSFKDYLFKLSTPRKGKEKSKVDKYINALYSKNDEWVKKFIKNIDFLFSRDKLFDLIYIRLKEKNIPERRIEHVFQAIDSSLRKMIYQKVKSGKKFTLSFEEYYKKFTNYFELGRNKKLPITLKHPRKPIPESSENSLSIRQLVDAEILSTEDDDYEDEIISVFTSKFILLNNIEQWLQDSEVTSEEMAKFNDDAKRQWEIVHKKHHLKLKRKLRKSSWEDLDIEEILDAAAQCYYEVQQINLNIEETELGIELSNGRFYTLSDEPSIGWILDWKERYSKDD